MERQWKTTTNNATNKATNNNKYTYSRRVIGLSPLSPIKGGQGILSRITSILVFALCFMRVGLAGPVP